MMIFIKNKQVIIIIAVSLLLITLYFTSKRSEDSHKKPIRAVVKQLPKNIAFVSPDTKTWELYISDSKGVKTNKLTNDDFDKENSIMVT